MPDSATVDCRLLIRPNSADVRKASEWLVALAELNGLTAAQSDRLAVCLNEVIANVIDHGHVPSAEPGIELLFGLTHENGLRHACVTVVEGGKAFDASQPPPLQTPTTLADAPVGGLGLVLLHRFADTLSYQRKANRNELTFGVNLTVRAD
jgi:anti-sigma regulatory factor (Ser/Thr protein kinase)